MRTNRRFLLAGALAGAVAPRALFSADKVDVVVVGAGLAGLQAARLLQEQGASVVVLEAADRVGGRVQSQQSERGVVEVGAADLGALYARNRETAAQLGLELAPWPATPMGSWYHLQGQSFVLADWPELDINPLDESLRKIPPGRLSGRFLPSPNPLTDLEAWLSPEFVDFDQPLGDLLRRNGAPEAAFKLMEVGHQFDALNDVSALWRMREQMVLRLAFTAARERGEPARFIVKGGLGRLPEAMAASLREEVRIGHRVSAIEQNQLGVTVTCANGARVTGRFVICAAPLTTVRNIAIEPALPPLVREAVDRIPYGRGTSVLLYINEPYWEVDGLPANFWTDLPIQRGFVNPAPAGGGFYLWMFSTGRADLARREADDNAIARYVIEELNRIRPSTRGRLEPAAVRSWTRDPFTLGTYASRAPGQISRFGNLLAEPVDRLLFAGEHTARLQMGLEGAMESGERAALQVIERL